MARADARFLCSRHPETSTKDVSDEVDQLVRHLREGLWPKEAVSPYERKKQEMLLYQRPTRPEEPGQIGCRIDAEQEKNAAACGNGISQRYIYFCLGKSRILTT